MCCRLSRADDPPFVSIRFRPGVNDENRRRADATYRLPSRLISKRIDTRQGKRIIENQLCCLEAEAVLALVVAIFGKTPSPARRGLRAELQKRSYSQFLRQAAIARHLH